MLASPDLHYTCSLLSLSVFRMLYKMRYLLVLSITYIFFHLKSLHVTNPY